MGKYKAIIGRILDIGVIPPDEREETVELSANDEIHAYHEANKKVKEKNDSSISYAYWLKRISLN